MLGAGAHSLLLGRSKPSADLFPCDLVGLSGIRKLKQNAGRHIIFSRGSQAAMSGCRQNELHLFMESVA